MLITLACGALGPPPLRTPQRPVVGSFLARAPQAPAKRNPLVTASARYPASIAAAEPAVTARRSIGLVVDAVRVNTRNYDYYYLCAELRRKRMIPIFTRIRAKSLKEFGKLVRHPGEEYIYVLEGGITVHTEFYDPVVLKAGESIYVRAAGSRSRSRASATLPKLAQTAGRSLHPGSCRCALPAIPVAPDHRPT